ncbi:MAG TPA: hypothetical protein PLW92_04005 [Chitinophagales bacterium]|nr:hypothetical protein [Chitinophagales bacterium]
MAIKKSECAYKTPVKLNDEFVEKCLGDKYLKEEQLLFIREGHVYNDIKKGEYVMIGGASGITSGYAYLNELDLAFPMGDGVFEGFGFKAIVILNCESDKIILPVKDFTEQNIKRAIGQKFKIDVGLLNCLYKQNDSFSVYGVKEQCPTLTNLTSTQPYYSEYPQKHFHYIRFTTAIL